MTLATRCPHCGTAFRVVADQLRVSQGWVRCGRCSTPFNAVEAMVEAERPAADEADVHPAFEVTAVYDYTNEVDDERDLGPRAVSADDAAGVDLITSDGAMAARAAPTAEQPDLRLDDEPAAGSPARQPDPASVPPAIWAGIEARESRAALDAWAAPDAGARSARSGFDPAPSFVVQADRAARWRQPRVRVALLMLGLLAAAALAAQAIYVFRDRIAAGNPAWRSGLQSLCAGLGCQVGEYHHLEALSVESSALVRAERASFYRLAVTLRNRSSHDVAAPAIDLTVSDSQGRPIARRVLTMAALGLPLRSLKAGSELPIQVPLTVAERAVSGYSVEIFYP